MQDEADAAIDAREVERTADFLDYYWNLAYDEANQAQGSGQHMRSVPTVAVKANIERYRRTIKNGYTVVEKKTREEWINELAEDIVSTLKETERAVLKELLKSKLADMGDTMIDRIAEMNRDEAKEYITRVKQERHRLLMANGMMRTAKVL
jgi:hypothetical protein